MVLRPVGVSVLVSEKGLMWGLYNPWVFPLMLLSPV